MNCKVDSHESLCSSPRAPAIQESPSEKFVDTTEVLRGYMEHDALLRCKLWPQGSDGRVVNARLPSLRVFDPM